MNATRLRHLAGGIAALGLGLALSGCPENTEQPTNDMLPVGDMLPTGDMIVGDMIVGDMGPEPDAGPDATPRPDAMPDAAPGGELGRAPELCVGCGAAASPRFRLIEHGLTPRPEGPASTAASPRFRLVLDP